MHAKESLTFTSKQHGWRCNGDLCQINSKLSIVFIQCFKVCQNCLCGYLIKSVLSETIRRTIKTNNITDYDQYSASYIFKFKYGITQSVLVKS